MAFIQSTQFKLKIAKVLYHFVKLFYKEDKRVIHRKGMSFEIDLREGLDLSMFLFGDFQSHIYKSPLLQIPKDGIVFDVGGNVGILSLFFAQKVPQGQVHAFEPTHFALNKFKRNSELNPELNKRIKLNNCFVSSKSEKTPEIKAFSSWRIDGTTESEGRIHEIHGGEAMDTAGVPSITLDEYCKEQDIQKISLIKIDTDGHEIDVLRGAKKSIDKYRPSIVFELTEYLMKERNLSFSDYSQFFDSVGYKMYYKSKQTEITETNYKSILPKNGSIDAFAISVD